MPANIRGLALEGGGICGLSHIGAAKFLEEDEILSGIDYFAGASAGSMAAGLLACRLPVDKIESAMVEFDFNQLKNSDWLFLSDTYRLFNQYGWNQSQNIERAYGKLLSEYIENPNITFQQLADEHQTHLVIPTTSWCEGKSLYYSDWASPDLEIKKAVCRSACYPIGFTPVNDKEDMYIDGGVLDNYPIRSLYTYLDPDEVIGVKLVSGDRFNIKKPSNSPYEKPTSVRSYIEGIIRIYQDQMLNVHVKAEDWERTIPANVGSISTLDFDISSEQKSWLIDQGYEAAKNYFDPVL